MEHKQQPTGKVLTEKAREERTEEQRERRLRLQIEALEHRVAPSALWTD